MEIKRVLTAEEMAAFIEDIVNTCISTDDEFEYIPHYKDYVERAYMLKYYGGMIFEDNSEAMDAAYSETFTNVLNEISVEQYNAIKEAAEQRINYLIEKNNFAKLGDIVHAISNKSSLDEIIDKITNAIDKVSSAFDGVDMQQFANDIHEMKFNGNSETLVDALIKAKMIKGDVITTDG